MDSSSSERAQIAMQSVGSFGDRCPKGKPEGLLLFNLSESDMPLGIHTQGSKSPDPTHLLWKLSQITFKCQGVSHLLQDDKRCGARKTTQPTEQVGKADVNRLKFNESNTK